MRPIPWLALALALAPALARATPPPACAEIDAQLDAELPKAPDALHLNMLLFSAARKGCTPAAERLLQAGASRLARDREGDTPLGIAAQSGRGEVVGALLADASPSERGQLDEVDTHGATPLMLAIHAGRAGVAQTLLSAGAKVDIADSAGETALAEAAFAAQEDLGEALLSKGAKPDTFDRYGKSPICYAAARGAVGLVGALLDAGVDAKSRYGHALTALMWAAGSSTLTPVERAVATVKLLIARGAEIDAKDDRGRNALMIAAALNHFEIASALLAAGADKTLRDDAGKSAADLAATPEMRALTTP